VGQGGKNYVPGEEFGTMYKFAGLAKWVWHYQIIAYTITDGIQPLVK
jgi:hypothetical protein